MTLEGKGIQRRVFELRCEYVEGLGKGKLQAGCQERSRYDKQTVEILGDVRTGTSLSSASGFPGGGHSLKTLFPLPPLRTFLRDNCRLPSRSLGVCSCLSSAGQHDPSWVMPPPQAFQRLEKVPFQTHLKCNIRSTPTWVKESHNTTHFLD